MCRFAAFAQLFFTRSSSREHAISIRSPLLFSPQRELILRDGNTGKAGQEMAWTRTQTIDARMGVRETMDRADWATAAVLHERYLDDVFRYVLRRVPSVPE